MFYPTLMACSLALAAVGRHAPQDDATILAAIAGGYDENRARFSHGDLAYDYEDGFADDASDAREGKLRDLCVARGEYTFLTANGRRAYRYSMIFPEADYRSHTTVISTSESSTRLDSFRALTNGKDTLYDQLTWIESSGMTHSSSIYPGMDQFFMFVRFPFDLGFPEEYRDDMAHQIRRCLAGEGGAKIGQVETDAVLDGKSLTRFTLQFTGGKSTYWVDPEKSWTPVFVRDDVDQGQPLEFYHDDFRQSPNGGWFPYVNTIFLGERSQRMVIKSADFEHPPADSRFQLEFDEPRRMVDRGRGLQYQDRQAVWRLDALPSAARAKPLSARQPTSSTPGGPRMPGERSPRSWYGHPVTLTVGILLAAALLVGWVYARRK